MSALSKGRQLVSKAKKEGRLLPAVIKIDCTMSIVLQLIKTGYVYAQKNNTFKYEGATDSELQEMICSIITSKNPRGTRSSTVRWARYRLQKGGLVENSGKRRDGAIVWRVKE